jgi:hypothetical protein
VTHGAIHYESVTSTDPRSPQDPKQRPIPAKGSNHIHGQEIEMTDYPTTSGNENRDQKLLTITEAADILRSPVATLRYWRHLGTGPRSFRLGRRVLYRYDDLTTWINTHHDGGSDTA